jgi:hypothetical protein
MKRQLGIAVAGAVLAAGTVAGGAFAVNGTNGTNSTHTNVSTTSHDPAAAAHAIQCVNLQLDIVSLRQRAATAKNAAQTKRLTRQANNLQARWFKECVA